MTDTPKNRRKRLEAAFDFLDRAHVIKLDQMTIWSPDGRKRYGIVPTHGPDRSLNLSEAEEWAAGAVAAVSALMSLDEIQRLRYGVHPDDVSKPA